MNFYTDLGIKEPIYYRPNSSMLKHKSIHSDDINKISIKDLHELLDEFEKEYAGTNLIKKSDIDYNEDIGDYYINEIGFVFHGYILDEVQLETYLQYELRKMIAELLDPKKEDIGQREVECSIMQLFREGTIDWDALQKITYKDCEL